MSPEAAQAIRCDVIPVWHDVIYDNIDYYYY